MATRFFARSLLSTTSRTFSSFVSRSYASLSLSTPPSSSLLRLRPVVAVAANLRRLSAASATVRGFSTRPTTSSLNDSNPNWSNRPPKETILLDGCDFEHWLVVMEKPDGDPTRDEIIDSYIKTLAQIVGSEEEARMKIYSVSTRCYFAFGALISEELSYKIKELPRVRWVLPDSYLDVKNKDYGGEPFINGQAVPYDPKYHEEWIRNNARANDRNRRNDRPRNFDRSRNFERRRDNMQNTGGPPPGAPPSNMGRPPNNMGPPPQPNMAPRPPPNMGGYQQGNMEGPPNVGGGQPNNWNGPPPSHNGGPPPPPSYKGGPPPPPSYNGGPPLPPSYNGGSPNMGPPRNNMGSPSGYSGGMPNNAPNYQQSGPNSGGMPYQRGPGPNREYPNSYPPNGGGGNPYQPQDMPGRDMPPPNYQ